MALTQMDDFTFKHSSQIDALYTQYTANQIKSLFDSRGVELRTFINNLVSVLAASTGAANIGNASITDLDGATVQAVLQSIRDKLKSVVDGTSGADFVNATGITGLTGTTVQSLLESLKIYVDVYNTNHKLSTSTDHDNRYYTETEIDSKETSLSNSINNLAGSGRTTETVKGNFDSITNHKTSGDHDTRYFTKDQLQSITDGSSGADNIKATPINANSGNTVQAQLEWLLTQIAVAATGSIPDGSITEVKLAQALVDKINTALSNVGVLTTLLTTNKTSSVNAINEVFTLLDNHKNDSTKHVTKDNTLQTGLNADEIDSCHAGIVANNVFKIPSNIVSGDVFYVNASNQVVRLPKGTDGQSLILNAGLPIWSSLNAKLSYGTFSDTSTVIAGNTTYTKTISIGFTGKIGRMVLCDTNGTAFQISFNDNQYNSVGISNGYAYIRTETYFSIGSLQNSININDCYISGANIILKFSNIDSATHTITLNFAAWEVLG